MKLMFAASKVILMAMAFSVVLSSAALAQSNLHQIIKVCSPHGDCSAIMSAKKSEMLCEAGPVRVAWTKEDRRYLLQCDCDCTDQDNKNWLVDKSSGAIHRIDYGRYVNKQMFSNSNSPKIPDKFSSHSMCHAAIKEKITGSTFIILNKLPSNGEDPYCYEPYYIIKNNNSLSLQDNTHILINGDPNAWVLENNPTTIKK